MIQCLYQPFILHLQRKEEKIPSLVQCWRTFFAHVQWEGRVSRGVHQLWSSIAVIFGSVKIPLPCPPRKCSNDYSTAVMTILWHQNCFRNFGSLSSWIEFYFNKMQLPFRLLFINKNSFIYPTRSKQNHPFSLCHSPTPCHSLYFPNSRAPTNRLDCGSDSTLLAF